MDHIVTSLTSASTSTALTDGLAHGVNISTLFPFNESHAVINLINPVFYMAPQGASTITETETLFVTLYSSFSDHTIPAPEPQPTTITTTETMTVSQGCENTGYTVSNEHNITQATISNNSITTTAYDATDTPTTPTPFRSPKPDGYYYYDYPPDDYDCSSHGVSFFGWLKIGPPLFLLIWATFNLGRLYGLLGGWVLVVGFLIEAAWFLLCHYVTLLGRGIVRLLTFLMCALSIWITTLGDWLRLVYRDIPPFSHVIRHRAFRQANPSNLWRMIRQLASWKNADIRNMANDS